MRRCKMLIVLLLIASVSGLYIELVHARGKKTKKLPPPEFDFSKVDPAIKKLQTEFLELKFGMFICYNMATFKKVSWVPGNPSPADFNPGVETVDTDAWADAAKSAGMKYGVLTVKHVSGFCLWDSKYTTYDVMHPDCPYKKDLVDQYVKSFKSRGLKVGLYYCWRSPGFGGSDKFKVLPPECDPATHSLEEQIDFQKKQIAELLEKYPDVFYIWNDALDPMIGEADEILGDFRKIRPDVIHCANWWNWAKKGWPYADMAVTELTHFPANNKHPGETCWCLDDEKWFLTNDKCQAKSAKEMFRHLRAANGRNANFLLNVGPDIKGNIIPSSIKALKEIGDLLKEKGK
jgi:alpha-L-fucosidase